MMKKIRILVVGLGTMGMSHVRANPLGIAHNHVIGRAFSDEFTECFGLEVRPRRCFNGNFNARFFRINIDEFLQIICRILFSPEDCQFFRSRC